MKPATIVVPKETTLVSLCVKSLQLVIPVLLLINALTLGRSDLGTGAGFSKLWKLTGPSNPSGAMRTGANFGDAGSTAPTRGDLPTGAARKVEANKTAKSDTEARAKAIWNAEAARDLFGFFFMGRGCSGIALRCLPRAFGTTRPYSFSFCCTRVQTDFRVEQRF